MSSKSKIKLNRRNLPFGSRNYLGYHSQSDVRIERPGKLRLSTNDLERNANLGTLTKESKRCLRNLAAYKPPKDAFPQPWLPFPRSRCAAVLVALFVGRKGDLYVLLSKRASTLRSFAGDTSLPGGKMDPEDKTIEDTARREAFEEIGLPPDQRKVPLLCVLEPFYVAKELLVTPVVVLILDNTLQPILNAPEVTALFSHPLASFLSSTPPASIIRSEPELVELGDDGTGYRYHISHDWDWDGPPVVVDPSKVRHAEKKRTDRRSSLDSDSNSVEPILQRPKFRMHQFLTGREAGGIKPVYGLTAAILIHTARVGYTLSPPALASPDFELSPPGSPSTSTRIAWAFCRPNPPDRPNLLRQALEEEGLAGKVDWKRVRKVAGVIEEDVGPRRGLKNSSSGSPSFGHIIRTRSKL
ncbi:NUDIX hydrolase domain-like protein [Lentinula edodes]|nr:NUDIX hydrolase domain-like protein [Lentinula edodes]